MMTEYELQKLFLLENNPELFEMALRPRSCGGNVEFEQLALYGDSVLDIHLYNYLNDKGIRMKGQVAEYKRTIHQGYVIKTFAEDVLGLMAITSPLDRTYQPKDRDLAEIFEALLGAAFKANGLEKCQSIVYFFVDSALEIQNKLKKMNVFDPAQDYKSKLFMMFQQAHLEEPNIEPEKVEWTDGSHTYQFDWQVIFNGERHEICTKHWSNKIAAEQEAAYIALCKIAGEYPDYAGFDPALDVKPMQEKTVTVKTSITSEELVFRKPSSGSGSMEVSNGNGELLVNWAKRKVKKDAYKMLVLLSSRADDVGGAHWICDTSEGVLALVNLKLGDEMHFAIGIGPSNSKARTNAAEKLILESNIFSWLEEHYPNTET
jgi:dsRNA-specific ribonuclease